MSDIRANLTIDGGLTGSLSIGSVHQDMVDRIEEVEARMSAAEDKLDAAEADIEARMSAAEDDIEARMSAAEDSVQDAIRNSLSEIVESRTDYFGYDHPTLQDRLTRDFDKINAKIEAYGYIPYEGTSIYASNTMAGSVNNTTIKARTLQNLMTNDPVINYTAVEDYDGWRPLYIEDNGQKVNIKPNTIYTIIVNVEIFNATGSYDLNRSTWEECVFSGSMYIRSAGRHKFVATSAEDLTNRPILLRRQNLNAKGDIKINHFMLLEGDHTQTPLEELPFIEGIESVGDKSKNLINETTLVDGGANSSTGDLVSDPERNRTDYIEVVPNVNYITKNVDSIFFYTENKEFIERQLVQGVTPENAKYMVCRVLKTSIEPQFNYGTILQKYQPYYEGYEISGKSIGKNLFNKENMEISSIYIAQGQNTIIKAQTLRGFIMKIKPNTNYVVSKSYRVEDCFRVYGSIDYPMINGNGENLAYGDGSNQLSFNTGRFEYIFCVCYTNKEGGDIDEVEIRKIFDTIQLEESTKLTPYEPCQESTYEYILDKPLRSLPNGVCDEIDLETGVLTRRIGKVVIDDSVSPFLNKHHENYSQFVLYMTVFNETNIPVDVLTNDNIICDTKPAKHQENGNDSVWIYDGNSIVFQMPSNINSQELMQQWLTSNPTTVYYELATPTTEQLTPQRLKSFDEITHVISDNKITPHISTTVPTDISLLIESMIQDNTMLANEVYDLRRSGEELLNEINELEEENLDNMEVSLDQEVRLTMLEMGV